MGDKTIIDYLEETLHEMAFQPFRVSTDDVAFYYGHHFVGCHQLSADTVKVDISLYCCYSDEDWDPQQLRQDVCNFISIYNGRNIDDTTFLYEDEGVLSLCHLFFLHAGERFPIERLTEHMYHFFKTIVRKAKRKLLQYPPLRDALGQYARWGCQDPVAEIASQDWWTDVRQYSEGLVAVADEAGRYGFLDAEAQIAIPCRWSYAQPFSENLAAVEDDHGRYGFIDRSGHVVIPCEWNGATWFSEGLAGVMDANGEWGYIDRMARLVIPCQWAEVGDFKDGRATVCDHEDHSYTIDRAGRINLIEWLC